MLTSSLGICAECIRNSDTIHDDIIHIHKASRKRFSLPTEILKNKTTNSKACKVCANDCQLSPEETGFCGLRLNKQEKIISLAGTTEKGLLDFYYDPLPTNCVGAWVCDGSEHPGMKNLAVFYRSCNFNCLFCQNWHFRKTDLQLSEEIYGISSEELASQVNSRTFCICYFGGDPSTQIQHALATSDLARRRKKDTRICIETNGCMDRDLLKNAVDLCLESGGCIKFDLKTFDEKLHLALCGNSNKATKNNFEFVSRYINERPEPPLLVASTLLVPGYVESEEVSKIANFIASLHKSIPYSLLGFYPHFYMRDLPTTSRRQMDECLQAARDAGLERVHGANMNILGI
jgi:pyruvate formate lyase activating enzyme